MALIKEIETDNGIVIRYHKINRFNLDTDKKTVEINIICYAHKKYRDMEKANEEIIRGIEEKLVPINKLNQEIEIKQNRISELIEQDEDEEERKDLSQEVNELTDQSIQLSKELQTLLDKKQDNLHKSVLETTVSLPLNIEKSYNLEILYNELKETELYKDSIDD